MYGNLNSLGIQFVKKLVSPVSSRFHFRKENVAYVRSVSASAISR